MNKTNKNTTNVFIFDIDGCVIPSFFPMLLTEEQGEKEQERIVEKANKKGTETHLFPSFLEYFGKFCKHNDVYFMTGRKESQFSNLTDYQLRTLNSHVVRKFEIIYYPENGIYNLDYYVDWKYNKTLLIFNFYYLDTIINKRKWKINVFDDNPAYFERLLKSTEKMNLKINVNKILHDSDWKNIITEGDESKIHDT